MSLPAILKKIRDGEPVTGSQIPKTSQRMIEHFVSIRAIELNILKRGSRYTLGSIDIFDAEVTRHFPEGLDEAIQFSTEQSRHLGVKVLKDAKISRKRYAAVQVNIRQSSNVKTREGFVPSGVERFTLSVLVDELIDWVIEGTIVLIENQEPFLNSTSKFMDSTAVICYNGRVNEKIISWIKESEMDVLFCPDYDPVGLDEYSKIKDSAPQRVRLFLPDSIEDDFKYSTSGLLDKKKNREVLSRLASCQPIDHDFGKVLSLIQQWNAGLMQEIYFTE